MGNQRQAIGGLEPFGEYASGDVRTELLDFIARDSTGWRVCIARPAGEPSTGIESLSWSSPLLTGKSKA